jgi:hypothetical protein
MQSFLESRFTASISRRSHCGELVWPAVLDLQCPGPLGSKFQLRRHSVARKSRIWFRLFSTSSSSLFNRRRTRSASAVADPPRHISAMRIRSWARIIVSGSACTLPDKGYENVAGACGRWGVTGILVGAGSDGFDAVLAHAAMGRLLAAGKTAMGRVTGVMACRSACRIQELTVSQSLEPKADDSSRRRSLGRRIRIDIGSGDVERPLRESTLIVRAEASVAHHSLPRRCFCTEAPFRKMSRDCLGRSLGGRSGLHDQLSRILPVTGSQRRSLWTPGFHLPRHAFGHAEPMVLQL